MGRESLSALKEASLAFRSSIHPDRGLDAALFLGKTGLVLASWTRDGVRLEAISVMAVTMLASIDSIVESLGGTTPAFVWVDGGDRQMAATRVGSRAYLVVIAPKSVTRRAVRNTMRELVAQLATATKKQRRRRKVSERPQRVNVLPHR